MTDRTSKTVRLYVIIILTVGLDQLTKYIVVKQMSIYQSITVIPGFFNLTRIHNPGGAFGFMAGQSQGIRALLFIAISLVAAGFVLYLYWQTPRRYPWFLTALALIFSGAAGNLIDRVRSGEVVDFLDFYLYQTHWPAFNVADSAISIGMTVIIIHLIFKKVPV
ncbi:MAG: signal peptidase II [Desulfosudaceae bacterium]